MIKDKDKDKEKNQDKNQDNYMNVTLSGIFRLLFYIFPKETFEITQSHNDASLILIESSGNNAGVMIYDLANSVAFGIEERWCELLEITKCLLMDQTEKVIRDRRLGQLNDVLDNLDEAEIIDLDTIQEEDWQNYAKSRDCENQMDLPIRQRDFV